MRPVRMQIQGFTCYRERQEVDFSRLRLFAIAGPTGAGKSSLLDAMTFALYGKIPRMGGQNLDEFISLGSSRASVLFEFDMKGDRYRVVRAMPRNGPKKVQLELISGGVERSLADGVGEVNGRLQQLLGLEYEAFLQSVLLPQGEFSKFLKSKPNEQRQILRDLLRLGVYERMRERAATKARELAGAIKIDRELLDGPYQAATTENVLEREKELELVKLEIAVLKRTLEAARSDHNEKKLQWDLICEREERRSRLRTLDALRLLIDQQRTSLARAERAASILPLLDQADRKSSAFHDSQAALEKITRSASAAEARRTLMETALREVDGRVQALPGKRSRMTALTSILPVIAERKNLVAQLNKRNAERKTCWENIERLTQLAWNSQEHLGKARSQMDLLSQERQQLGYDAAVHEIVKRARIPAHDLIQARREVASLEPTPYEAEIASSSTLIEATKASLREAESAHSGAEQLYEATVVHLRDVEQQHRAASLRTELQPGCPCPVCGQAVTAIPEYELPEDLKDAIGAVERSRGLCDSTRRAFDTAREKLTKSESRLQTAQDRFEDWKQNEKRLRAHEERLKASLLQVIHALPPPAGVAPEEFVEREFAISERLYQAHAALGERLQKAQKTVHEQEAALDRANLSLQNEEQTKVRLAGEIADAEQRLADCDQQIAHVDSADPSHEAKALESEIHEIETQFREATNNFDKARSVHEELRKELIQVQERNVGAEREKNECRTLADEAIRNAEFSDPSEVRKAFLEPPTISAARTKIRQFDQDLHSTHERIRELDELLTGVSLAEAEVQKAEQLALSLGNQLNQLNQQCGSKSNELDRLRLDTETAECLRSEHERRRGQHRLVDQLSRDLQSDRFQHYLLEGSFRRLVAGASVRLRELNERYELAFSDNRFVVVDHDHGSLTRFADTLSGGETFLVSLALALELSEQVQRAAGAVRLDSLFIDEGFGTLDPETLETVAEAIESLTKTNRMVGVITHVAELHRRLPRLEVRPSSSGSSVHYVDESV